MSVVPVAGLSLPPDLKTERVDPKASNHAHVVQVAVGEEHGLLLTDQGFVYSWAGKNDSGQLGRKAQKEQMFKPMPITEGLKEHIVIQIACGKSHSLALTQQGKVLAWGSNKAGQLGIRWMARLFRPKEHTKNEDLRAEKPEVVEPFTGDDPSSMVRSISCGPESSACVTVKGDVYVWGAISYYLHGQGRSYARGDNCTLPVKLRNWRDEVSQLGQEVPRDMTVTKIALYRSQLACTMGHSSITEDLESMLSSLKSRGNLIVHQIRLWKSNDNRKQDMSGNDMELEELKTLRREWDDKIRRLNDRINAIKQEKSRHEAEFQRLSRELTVCDQQDTALTDATVKIEVKKSEGHAQHAHVQARNLETQLNDLNHFKDANKRTKMRLLEQRDRSHQLQWELEQELKDKLQEVRSVEMRSSVLRNLQHAGGGPRGGSGSTIDEGLNIAFAKHQELAATNPEQLAGVGQFTGFREVMMISDRALQDVSSALKEVSAALGGREGAVLESVLEVNLKLRKEHNAAIYDKIQRVEGRQDQQSAAGDAPDARSAEGMPDYFNEARSRTAATSQFTSRRQP